MRREILKIQASLLIGLCLFAISTIKAQDTTVVQTLDYNSNSRSGIFDFPDDPTATYRKIIMQYSMRCLNGEVNPGNNSTGCFEWDYSCNTFITDSSLVDSTLLKHPSHIIPDYSGTSFAYVNQPTHTYYQATQTEVVVNDVISESVSELATGSENLSHPFSTSVPEFKAQYLLTSSELESAGLSAGDVNGLSLNIASLGEAVDYLRLRMKNTAVATLDNTTVDTEEFEDVYHLNTTPTLGTNKLYFHTPFDWDGQSNLLVEFSYSLSGDQQHLTDYDLTGASTISDLALIASGTDHFIALNNSDNISVGEDARRPASEIGLPTEDISIEAWVNVKNFTAWSAISGFLQDNGSSEFGWAVGTGASNNFYFALASEGNSLTYLYTPEGYEVDTWYHIAATYDGVNMRVYIDGEEVISSTNNNGPISYADSWLRIGSYKDNNEDIKLHADLDDLRIWDGVLDANTIQEWMHKRPAPGHPNYANLFLDYSFDDPDSFLEDASSNGNNGLAIGIPTYKAYKGVEIFKNMSVADKRPQLGLLQGNYDLDFNESIVIDSVDNEPIEIRPFEVVGSNLIENPGFLVWAAYDEFLFDEDGEFVDSYEVEPDGFIEVATLDYYTKRPGKFEIMSFVTPYGFGLDLGPNGKTWTFDVTDFAPILKGQKFLNMELGGEFNEEIDIKFLFISGTPPRDVQTIENIWPFARGWYNPITENRIFEPRTVQLSPTGSAYKIRSSITGHGQNGEFIPRTHFVNLDGGDTEYEFAVWKECADNPIYPQGGTWIFDRAGWCPGSPTDLREFDISSLVTIGGAVEVDYGVRPTGDQSETNYLATHQLVTYGPPNFSLDAEILDIISPNTKVEHARHNPVCNNPVITIKNTGSTTLTSLRIDYGVSGGSYSTYNWTGSLDFLESEEVVLPTPDFEFWQLSEGIHQFEASVSSPNGSADQNPDNDNMSSDFQLVDRLEGTISFKYRTNNRAYENRLILRDHAGSIVLERDNMSNQTIYEDEIDLLPGCYSLEFSDTGDDGLDFWFWAATGQNVGTGYFSLGQDNAIVKIFEPDFGNNIRYDFFVEGTTAVEERSRNQSISVYPNPSSDNVNIEIRGWDDSEIMLQFVDVSGRLLFEDRMYQDLTSEPYELSLRPFAPGVYFLKVSSGNNLKTLRLIKE